MNNASEKNKRLVLQGFDTGTMFGAIFLILFSWDRRALGITALDEMRKEG